MLKLRRILNKDNSHILKVHFVLHVFNLIAKKIVNHPIIDPVVKGNKNLDNYFTHAGFWRKHLTTWQKENNVKHSLTTLCKKKWYTMAKVCMGVQEPEGGFRSLGIHCDPLIDTPSMTTTVINVIEDHNHFTANQTLVSLLKPVVDAIGNLEQVADIWKHILDSYKSIQHHMICFSHLLSWKPLKMASSMRNKTESSPLRKMRSLRCSLISTFGSSHLENPKARSLRLMIPRNMIQKIPIGTQKNSGLLNYFGCSINLS
ncbi:hypothetical protein VP01_2857g2 [Puccinia sorghi]|uniref:Uncharacterized protein n=1 Tax=Puccinia sorghi TaxID=27349 RepID=A0A0L6V200_9BASI|nr:hypothetical protein VP01_2857g2 [Puccinia sorghi]